MSIDEAKRRARALHEEALALSAAGEVNRALRCYLEALALDPRNAAAYSNVGLIYKNRGDWAKALRYTRRAVELAPHDKASLWNLAIAATALRDWATARHTWARLGFDIDPAGGDIETNLGLTPVRLNPASHPEVVWARRIDPVRARIVSIPYPSSGFRHADVVLHDAAPEGSRLLLDQELSVFNVFELFQASRFSTFEARLQAGESDDIAALEEICENFDVELEDWSATVRSLCHECSTGSQDPAHAERHPPQDTRERIIGLAGDNPGAVREVLHRWQGGDRRVLSFRLALAPP